MLVLSRRVGERLVIDDRITVTVVEIRGGQIRLGIEAPREIPVWREEVAVRKKMDLVVAIKEAEQRQMMKEPLFVDQVEYWHVDDLDCAQPEEALPVLEDHVRALVERLAECRT